MKKILPLISNSWHNYQQYLDWINTEIKAIEDYLWYFKPHYNILNAPLSYIDTNTLGTSEIETSNTIEATVEVGTETKYLIFPSKLLFRQAILNTHPEAFVCYFDPDQLPQSLSEDQWNKFIERPDIDKLKPSMITMAKYWRHSGVQEDSNPEGFGRDKYILISKPSSSWYLINTSKDEVNFSFVPSALNDAGSIITFSLELIPSRYINTTDSSWGKGASIWSRNATSWSKVSQITPDSKNIINQDGAIWSNNYPILHEIEFVNDNVHEEFIVDNYFTTTRENMANHPTHSYHIYTNLDQYADTNNNMWIDNIKVLIC